MYQNSYASMRSINNNSCQCQDTVNGMWILLGPILKGKPLMSYFQKIFKLNYFCFLCFIKGFTFKELSLDKSLEKQALVNSIFRSYSDSTILHLKIYLGSQNQYLFIHSKFEVPVFNVLGTLSLKNDTSEITKFLIIFRDRRWCHSNQKNIINFYHKVLYHTIGWSAFEKSFAKVNKFCLCKKSHNKCSWTQAKRKYLKDMIKIYPFYVHDI